MSVIGINLNFSIKTSVAYLVLIAIEETDHVHTIQPHTSTSGPANPFTSAPTSRRVDFDLPSHGPSPPSLTHHPASPASTPPSLVIPIPDLTCLTPSSHHPQ